METKERNYSLDVFRLVASLLVIVCHADLLVECSDGVYQFVARFMPRMSVVFFFTISGFYLIQALLSEKKVFIKQFKSLMKVYITWTIIYYLASFIVNIVINKEDIVTFLIQRVVFFVGEGSYSHFWYFPALIYSVCITCLVHKLFGKKGLCILSVVSLVLFAFANLGSSYYEIGIKIPYFNQLITEHRYGFEVFRGIFGMGLPYFTMGYFLNIFNDKIRAASKRTFNFLFVTSLILYMVEIFILSNVLKWYQYPEVFVMLYPFGFMVFALFMRNPAPVLQKYAKTCQRLSGFLYYIHPLLILVLTMAANVIGIVIPSPILYLLVIGIGMVSGLVLIRLKWDLFI